MAQVHLMWVLSATGHLDPLTLWQLTRQEVLLFVVAYGTPGWAYDVAVKGSYAYVAAGRGGLQIYKNLLIDVEEGGKLSATAEEYLSKGESAFKKEDYDSAILYYTKAIGCLKYAKAYLWRGIAYTRKSQFLEVKQDFENVIELEPKGNECPQVLEIVAECYEKLGKVDKSAQYYHRAGYIYSHAEEHRKAAQSFSKTGQTYEKIKNYGSAAWEYVFAGDSYLKAAKTWKQQLNTLKQGICLRKLATLSVQPQCTILPVMPIMMLGLKAKLMRCTKKLPLCTMRE